MKRKKVMALLLAATVIATVPTSLTSNMVVLAATASSTNTGNLQSNSSDINNSGTIDVNESSGTVVENTGTITTNKGTVEENKAVENNQQSGIITTNEGKVDTNDGFIHDNKDTVVTNNINITTNEGMVNTNNGAIQTNGVMGSPGSGTVNKNTGSIFDNYGIVSENTGIVSENRDGGEVKMTAEEGRVGENYGTVKITGVDEEDSQSIIDTIHEKIECNYGTVEVSTSTQTQKYYGLSGYNGKVEDEYYILELDTVKEGDTFTLSIPVDRYNYYQYGVTGDIILKQSYLNSALEYNGSVQLVTNSDGDYIIPLGSTFTVKGCAKFIAAWYREVIQNKGIVTDEMIDVIEDTLAPVSTPKQQMTSSSVPGVAINNWNDVSSVIATKADAIQPEPNSNTKLLKLELKQGQMEIPKTVVSDLASSSVDGLHCFIGGGDAITFVDNGTLDGYVPTDFSHKTTLTNNLKFIDFTSQQAIGATVLMSTRVPAINKPVAVWMLVDGQYQLVGQFVTNETGNVAFPISSTGNFVITF